MNPRSNTGLRHLFGALFLCLFSIGVFAETSIAILDFDLNDQTLIPRTPAEIQRTASIKPMLEGELKRAGYKIISVDLNVQHEANAGFGYLFDHNDIAAGLAKNAGADYIVVGRLHKPSFLFAYIMGHLVRAKDGQLIGNYITETKGGDKKLTLKGVEDLAVKIDNDLDKIYAPPPPSRAVGLSDTSAVAEAPSQKPHALAFGDAQLKWGPCPPLFPKGCEIAVLHGDLTKPNADVFLKVPANYTIPSHWHSSAERMILVSGELRIEYTGHNPSVLKPGTYAYGPTKAPHKASCTNSGPCVLFIAFEAPVDAHLDERLQK
jgi:mannose-6-phosphate isomerase-like protein (cupin superfamily)